MESSLENLSPEQLQVMGMLVSNPQATEVIKQTIMGHLLKSFAEEIEADPTIENPDAIMELLGKGAGYLDDLVAGIGQFMAAQAQG